MDKNAAAIIGTVFALLVSLTALLFLGCGEVTPYAVAAPGTAGGDAGGAGASEATAGRGGESGAAGASEGGTAGAVASGGQVGGEGGRGGTTGAGAAASGTGNQPWGGSTGGGGTSGTGGTGGRGGSGMTGTAQNGSPCSAELGGYLSSTCASGYCVSNTCVFLPCSRNSDCSYGQACLAYATYPRAIACVSGPCLCG